MVKAPSFTLTNVTKNLSYGPSTIMMNQQYGGLHFTIGGMGRRSAFNLVLDNHDGQLNDNTKNNGLVIENRDEVKLYGLSPSDNITTNRLIFHGYVLKASRPISQDHDRVVKLSGLSFFDFWNDGSLYEHDYRIRPDTVTNVVKNALRGAHTNFIADVSKIPKIDTLVFKRWVACTPADCLIECCAAYNQELHIGPDDKPELFAVNSQASGFTFDDTKVVDGGELGHTSEDSHYDQIKFLTNNPYFAPNSATPTTTSFSDDYVFWRIRDPDATYIFYFDPLQLDTNYAFYNPEIAKTQNGIFKAGLFGGIFQTIGIQYTQKTISQMEVLMSGAHNTQSAGSTNLNLTEADWETFNFIIQNGFKGATSFKIRLYDDHGNTDAYWESKELISDISLGVVRIMSLYLPSNNLVDPAFWTKTGSPTHIDVVGFTWRGGTGYNSQSFLGNVYFQGMLRATATKAGTSAPFRQKVIVDKTVTDGDDATSIAASELTRLQSPAIIGGLNVEGSFFYVKPGQTAVVNFPSDGFNSVAARIDSIAHHVVENNYTCDVAFAPLMVKNALWNRLAEISLRKNEQGDENIYAAAEQGVGNSA